MSQGNEVVIRLVLDTSQAEQAIEDIDKGVREQKREVERSFGDKMKGLTYAGVGFLAGNLTAQAKGGFSTVLGETIGPYASQFENWVFGGQQIDARAAQSAREQTIQAMGMDVGRRGLQQGHKTYFEQIKSVRMMEERGRQLIESNPDMYGGFDFGKAWDRLSTAIADGVKAGVDYLWSKL